MTKICYKKKTFARRNLELIDEVNVIIRLHKDHNSKPSVISIFNRLVKLDLVEDGRKSYKRVLSVITNARTAGLIGWDDIDGRKQRHEGDIDL
tara:strand:+ start:69 stop:347 length:279 start_codon:yes stop_codon:yes gene_type:complete